MASLTGTKIKDTYDSLLKVSDNGGLGASAKQITDGLGTGSPLYLSTTKLGIGIDSPQSIFQVKTGTDNNIGFNVISGGTLNGIQRITSYNDAFTSTVPLAINGFDLYFTTGSSNAERMRIDSSGNVGIGGTITDKLTLVNGQMRLTNNYGIRWGSNQVGIYGDDSSYGLKIHTAGTERMRITSGGYLKASNNGSYLNSSGNYHELVTSTDSEPVNVIIHKGTSGPSGTSTQFTAASPNNTVYYFQEYVDSTTTRCKIWSNGNIQNFNNSYGALSDSKLKENIVDASPKLVDLMQVKIRNYNLIGDDKKQIGVVAQELEEVFPAMIDESPDFEEREVELKDEDGNIVYKTEQVLVSEAIAEELDADGNVITPAQEAVYETVTTDRPVMTTEKFDLGTVTKSVKYSVFVPMLIKAIQELKAEVDALKGA